jgi:hypothetical protein
MEVAQRSAHDPIVDAALRNPTPSVSIMRIIPANPVEVLSNFGDYVVRSPAAVVPPLSALDHPE